MQLHRYVQVDKNGFVVSDSYLSAEVNDGSLIEVTEDFDPEYKRLDLKEDKWVDVESSVFSNDISNEEISMSIEYLTCLLESVMEGGLY